ncbi:hypothetical protein ACH5RR_033927 [Cinchona calisaya]|uniref:Uncharacterized protein n=1 Tax=Cinchona calisaya TaxID=153742 RepID=A0ABD2YBL7_9GENT
MLKDTIISMPFLAILGSGSAASRPGRANSIINAVAAIADIAAVVVPEQDATTLACIIGAIAPFTGSAIALLTEDSLAATDATSIVDTTTALDDTFTVVADTKESQAIARFALVRHILTVIAQDKGDFIVTAAPTLVSTGCLAKTSKGRKINIFSNATDANPKNPMKAKLINDMTPRA